jgi:hypothetical protein
MIPMGGKIKISDVKEREATCQSEKEPPEYIIP